MKIYDGLSDYDIEHIIDIQDDTTALLSYINDLVLLEHNLDYDKGYDDGYEKGLSDGNHIGWCECYDTMSDDD